MRYDMKKKQKFVIRNVGFERNICGVHVGEGAVISLDENPPKTTAVDHNGNEYEVTIEGIRIDESDNIVATQAELERFLLDWPLDFEQVEDEPEPEAEPAKPAKSAAKEK